MASEKKKYLKRLILVLVALQRLPEKDAVTGDWVGAKGHQRYSRAMKHQ